MLLDDQIGEFTNAFIQFALPTTPDTKQVMHFVCFMYGCKSCYNVNKAMYILFQKMAGKKTLENPMGNIISALIVLSYRRAKRFCWDKSSKHICSSTLEKLFYVNWYHFGIVVNQSHKILSTMPIKKILKRKIKRRHLNGQKVIPILIDTRQMTLTFYSSNYLHVAYCILRFETFYIIF